MEDLIREYKETLNGVRRAYQDVVALKHAKQEMGELAHEEAEEQAILGGMISDLQYAIKWMETGRRPESRRGIERRGYAQRTYSIDDPNLRRKIELYSERPRRLPDDQVQLLDGLLDCLSPREYEAFVAVRGKCLTFGQAADMLFVSKGTVQAYVESAERKLRQIVNKDCREVQMLLF